MSSSARAPATSSEQQLSHFFLNGEKCEKTLDPALHANLQEDLEGNHDANHRELECQRSALQSASTVNVVGENLENSIISTTSWSVNDLLHRRRRTLSWEKTLRTSNTTTTRNCSGNKGSSPIVPPSAAHEEPPGKDRMSTHEVSEAPRCAAEPAPVANGPGQTLAATRRVLPRTAGRAPPPRLLFASVSVVRYAQPRPCSSSVPVGRSTCHHVEAVVGCCGQGHCDALLLVSTMSAGVAVFSATRSRGRHAASCRPPGSTERSPNKSSAQPF